MKVALLIIRAAGEIYGKGLDKMRWMLHQQELQLAVKMTRKNFRMDKTESAMIAKSIAKMGSLRGTRIEILVLKSFADKFHDAYGGGKLKAGEMTENEICRSLETAIDEEQHKTYAATEVWLRTEVEILDDDQMRARTLELRKKEDQRPPGWLRETLEEEAEDRKTIAESQDINYDQEAEDEAIALFRAKKAGQIKEKKKNALIKIDKMDTEEDDLLEEGEDAWQEPPKGKGKSKGKYGGKSKGKSGKDKAKGKSKGKGKMKDKNKGKTKGKGKEKDCYACGEIGHIAMHCPYG